MEDHPNYSEIEAERAAIFGKLKAAEDGWFEAHGCYLQALISPGEDQDGNGKVAFNRNRRPTDIETDWSGVLGAADIDSGVRCQYAVDRYDGPNGSGFILSCRVVWQGKEWIYREHHGPEEVGAGFEEWVEVSSSDGQ